MGGWLKAVDDLIHAATEYASDEEVFTFDGPVWNKDKKRAPFTIACWRDGSRDALSISKLRKSNFLVTYLSRQGNLYFS